MMTDGLAFEGVLCASQDSMRAQDRRQNTHCMALEKLKPSMVKKPIEGQLVGYLNRGKLRLQALSLSGFDVRNPHRVEVGVEEAKSTNGGP